MPLFQSLHAIPSGSRGDALRFALRLPLAIIFRTFGAPILRTNPNPYALHFKPEFTNDKCPVKAVT